MPQRVSRSVNPIILRELKLALETIRPFTYRAFNAEVGETVRAIINYFRNNDPNFWQATFRRYSFRGSNYQQGEEVRLEFNEKLTTCTDRELLDVANEILEWGGMGLSNQCDETETRKGSCLSQSTCKR